MKKFIAAMLSVTCSVTALAGMTGFAADNNIDISEIGNNGNIISIKAINSLPNDTVVTLVVTKDDAEMTESDRVYVYAQEKVPSGETVEFSFIIPDEKNDVSSSGKYVATVQNRNRDRDEEVFYYADTEAINDFIDDLKAAAESVTDPDKAYEALMPLMSEENAGAIFGLGIDYNVFETESDSVKNDTLNLLYEAGIGDLDTDTAADAFTAAFGLAVYNDGDKEGGIEIYSPTYGGEKMDSGKFNAAAGKMNNSYNSIEEFQDDLLIAYGLVLIAEAKVGTVGDALDAFAEETGECTAIINKIASLSAVKKKTAYEYVVKEADSNTDSADELESILESAYKNASASSGAQGGSGSGSGGGASGSSSNRVQSGGGSVSAPQGSGTPDEKAETVYIFPDLSEEHWAAEAVSVLKSKGIVSGTDMGMFEPDRAVTREEFAKMLVSACGFETDGSAADFSDTEADAWYAPYIGAAAENDIVRGIGDNKFGIGSSITRQDMSVMISRAIKALDVYLDFAETRAYIPFDDEGDIAEYALSDIKELFEAGIVNGKGNNMFDPLGSATRAEAAKIIYEAFKGGV